MGTGADEAAEPDWARLATAGTSLLPCQAAERVQLALTDEVQAELRGTAGASRIQFCVHVRIGKPAEELLGVAHTYQDQRVSLRPDDWPLY